MATHPIAKEALLLAALALLLLFSGCTGRETTQPSSAEPIQIGSILILTGEGSSWGQASKRGMDLAIEKINAEGGVLGRPLLAVHEDDQGEPKQAVSAFHKLTAVEQAQFIIGPTWSPMGLAIAKLADQKKIVVVSPSLGVKEFNESSPYLFNTWPHDFILSEHLAELAYEAGHRNVAIFGTKQVWVEDQTRAFTQRFEALGGQVGLLVEPNPDTLDLGTEAARVKQGPGIDAVILTSGVMNVGARGARRMREMGVTLPFYSMTLDKNIIKVAEGAYEGLVFPTFLTPDPAFERAYAERFGTPLEIGGDTAYDAVMLLAEAIRETGSTEPEKVKDYLNAVKRYEGVSGSLEADGKGGFTKPYKVLVVRNGEPVPLA